MRLPFLCPACCQRACRLYSSTLRAHQTRVSISISPDARYNYTKTSNPNESVNEEYEKNIISSHTKEILQASLSGPPKLTDKNQFNDHSSSPVNHNDHGLPTSVEETSSSQSEKNLNPNIRKTFSQTSHSKSNDTRIIDRSVQSKQNIASPSSKINYYNTSDVGLRLEEARGNPNSKGFRVRFTNVNPVSGRIFTRPSPKKSSSDGLESMFKETVAHSNFRITIKNPISGSLDQINMFASMMSQNYPISEIWTYFCENFSPDSEQRSLHWNFKRCLQKLLQIITESKRRDPFNSKVPSIAEVTDAYIRYNFLNGREWADLTATLLAKISLVKDQPVDDQKLVTEILDGWDVACRKIGDMVTPLSSAVARSIYEEFGLNCLFRMVIPQVGNRDLSKVPLVAVATFAMLTDETKRYSNLMSENAPLVQKLATVISVPGLDIKMIVSPEENSGLKPFVLRNWVKIQKKACQIAYSPEELEDQPLQVQKSTNKSLDMPSVGNIVPLRGIDFIHHRLRSAINLKNHSQVAELWLEVSSWPVLISDGDVAFKSREGFLSLEICHQFILAYMTLQRPNEAIIVWNHMMKAGLKPTTKTWNILMSGCKAVSDWRSAETIWNKMIQTGLKPDVMSWSARISTLIECKEVDMGIRVLDEMGRIWLAAALQRYPKMDMTELKLVGDIDDVPKPDIACLNIAISGLLSQGKKEHAHQTLSWGQNLGIKPDIITYNIFLRPLVRNGNQKEAMKLLKRMQKAGIEADIATYTIILDQVLRDPDQYSPEQQKKMVQEIFTDMAKVNVRPNLLTYGKIIFQLIRNFNPANEPTIAAVLRRMHLQGLNPSVQIYTSLIEYYFFQDPPDMAAARHMIDQATSIVGLDRVFWDKVISCYAQVGDTSAALRILSSLTSQNTRVGWAAMRKVLESLAAKKEWELAKELVQDVEIIQERQDFREGTQGEEMFWELARRMNLIE